MVVKPCKMTTAVSLIFMLALLTIGGQGTAAGNGCSPIQPTPSKTFKGDCYSIALCIAPCRREGYTAGYCNMDAHVPEYLNCLCTKPCPPEPPPPTSRGNIV